MHLTMAEYRMRMMRLTRTIPREKNFEKIKLVLKIKLEGQSISTFIVSSEPVLFGTSIS